MTAGTPAGTPFPDLAALFRAGRHVELERAALDLLALHPDHGFAWKALGVAQAALGRTGEALAAKARAAQLLPQDSEAQVNLANALISQGHLAQAEASLRRAVQIDPSAVGTWAILGQLLARQGRYRAAQACLGRVTQLRPESADAHNALGNLQRDWGRMEQASDCYRQALALRPGFGQAHNNLGNTLADLGMPQEAEQQFRMALAALPGQAEIHSNLGNLLKDMGRLPEAQAAYRAAVERDPTFDGARSNLLLAMNHDAALEPAAALDEARRFGAVLAARVADPLAAHRISPPQGPLRVGMVSGDLRNHPVGYFLEGLLAQLNPAQIQLFGYPTIPRSDELTERIKPRFAQWRCLQGLSDEAAARLIHADAPDVLLDLSGHTAHNRLGVFAWRPAPVQASWLGYFATTGLTAMDWLIADRASIPEAARAQFTERIWYLPRTRLCFTPPTEAPPVGPPPALATGFVTFGSFQNLGKANEQVLALWAQVLASVPGSRLRWQNTQLGDEATRDQVRQRLGALGIDPRRLSLHGKVSRRAYLAAYGEVDIVLDTFPYPGGTTTCEALWMGVPVVTLQGERMLSRQGPALLEAATLPQWVAPDRDAYVRTAVSLALDPAALAQLRSAQRQRVAASPVFDAPAFAADFQQALQGMAAQAH